MHDRNIVIAGAAGQGVQSAATILGKTLLRLGFHVYTSQDYQSRVRGGHNFMSIRFSDGPLCAFVRRSNFLLALNTESLSLHLPHLEPDGFALCMAEDAGSNRDPRIRALPPDLGPAEAKHPRFVAVKLLSMLFGLMGFEPEHLRGAIRAYFGKKLKPEILQVNLDTIDAVSASVQSQDVRPLSFAPGSPEGRMLVSGNDAIALGMIAAGIGVYAGYPMTPSTSILNLLAENGPKLGIAVEQAEDEIAALNMAIGASYAGARAAAGTSGSGFCLMSEAVGLAGVTETPVVIVDAQRPGPAVGMATRTEQSDLLFVIHASQGEFPRAVLAPATHEDAFFLAAESFNIAERWQVPVILMDDQHFADSQCTLQSLDDSRVVIDRGPLAPEPDEPAVMRRYKVTESGVSPRAFPVLSNWIIACDSHEHDEVGHLTDDPANRVRQVDKRMRKLEGIRDSFPGPEILGDADDLLLLCWGSTVGAVREAVGFLREKGHRVGAAVFRHLYPMNVEKVRAALSNAKRLITIEGNYAGQLGGLLRMETGVEIHGHIAKIDGRPFAVEDAILRIEPFLEDAG